MSARPSRQLVIFLFGTQHFVEAIAEFTQKVEKDFSANFNRKSLRKQKIFKIFYQYIEGQNEETQVWNLYSTTLLKILLILIDFNIQVVN